MTKAIQKREDLGAALLQVEGRGERTTEAYRGAIRAFEASGQPATVEGFAAYVDSLKATRSAATVNLAVAAGRKAFVMAAERVGLPTRELAVIKGALAEIRGVKIAPPEVSVITPAERRRLLAALPLRMRLIAEVLYLTGARVSEILGVRRDSIRIDGAVELRLLGKGGKQRDAKIPPGLYGRVLAVFPDGPFLFTTGQGNRYAREYVTREIGRASRRVLGRRIGAHVLRHSRATDLLATTHRIKAVSRLLGHSDEATTLRYYVKDSFTDAELFDGADLEEGGADD
ncbi:Tyrosine recombinase XerC [subsurface metagenome]